MTTKTRFPKRNNHTSKDSKNACITNTLLMKFSCTNLLRIFTRVPRTTLGALLPF